MLLYHKEAMDLVSRSLLFYRVKVLKVIPTAMQLNTPKCLLFATREKRLHFSSLPLPRLCVSRFVCSCMQPDNSGKQAEGARTAVVTYRPRSSMERSSLTSCRNESRRFRNSCVRQGEKTTTFIGALAKAKRDERTIDSLYCIFLDFPQSRAYFRECL